jgi:hypothetical protein
MGHGPVDLKRETDSGNRLVDRSAKPAPSGPTNRPRLHGKWLHRHAWGVRGEHLKVIEVAGHNQAATSR